MIVTRRLSSYIFFCVLAYVLWGFASPLLPGELRGRVLSEGVPQQQTSILSRSIIQRYAGHQFEHSDATAHKRADLVAVVYVTGIPEASGSEPQSFAVMDQQHERFEPHVLPIVVGTSVRFLNSEEVFHNVFSLSSVKSFDLGRYPKGQYREVVFDKAGIVSVYCDIHTQMNAVILVLPNRFFAATDAAGNFVIPDIPAGTYEVRIWYGRQPEKVVKVEIEEQGVTELNLSVP